MAIQKKSLIGNLAAAKKAIVATNVASTPAAKTASPVTLAKGGAHQFTKGVQLAKFAKGGANLAKFAKNGVSLAKFAKNGASLAKFAKQI